MRIARRRILYQVIAVSDQQQARTVQATRTVHALRYNPRNRAALPQPLAAPALVSLSLRRRGDVHYT
jgi:hypothetical protein